MSFTVESESVARSRRNRRAAITVAVIVALLFGVFYFAASYWNTPPTKATATTSSSCTPTPGTIQPSQITVNVYNATKRNGLAGSTAKAVKDTRADASVDLVLGDAFTAVPTPTASASATC